jgi:hypothetical protein
MGWQRSFPYRRLALRKSFEFIRGPFFDYNSQTDRLTMIGYGWTVSAQYWVVALVLGALPCWWVIGWAIARRASRRSNMGHCLICGYDLRATPERCPECGTVSTFTELSAQKVAE